MITMGFSQDAIRKFLERLYQQIMIGNHRPQQGESAESALKKLIDEQCAFTANEMKVYVGSQLVVDIVNQERFAALKNSECIKKLDKLLKLD
jgi:hypothetical protein